MSTIKCACGGKHCKIQLVIEDARHWMITDKDCDDTLMYFSQETIRQLRTILNLEAESSEARAEALEKQLEAVTAERDALKRSLSEALNSGDGVYRP